MKAVTREETAVKLSKLPLFKDRDPHARPSFVSSAKISGYVTLANAYWQLDAEPYVMERARRLFNYGLSGPSGKRTHRTLWLRRTQDVARDLTWLMSRYAFDVDAGILADITRLSDRYEQVAAAVANADQNFDFRQSGFALKMAEPPRPHQVGFKNFFDCSMRILLADQLGLGKTISAITACLEPEMRPALFVVPTHLPTQWKRQIERFVPDASIHVIKGRKSYELPKVDFVLTAFTRLQGWEDILASYGFRTIGFDEIQDLRHFDTAKRSIARALSSKADFCLGLSATPIYNYGSEIWSVIDVIAPEALGPRDAFKAEWCGYDEKVRNPDALNSFLRSRGLMLRRTRSNIGLPEEPVAREVITLEGDLESLAKIQDVAKALALSVLSNVVGESDESARELDWKLRQATGVAKAKAVAAFVKLLVDDGEKVLLCGWHREVYDIWAKEFKSIKTVMYTGSESPAAKDKAFREFDKGDAKVFICSLRSGAGLDGLQRTCRSVVFGELDWSPQVMEQVIGRLAREGQERAVTAYFLVLDDGSDPFVMSVLGEKRSQHDGVIEGKTGDAEILADAGMRSDRIRAMAEGYLASVGEAIPKVAPCEGLMFEAVQALGKLRVPSSSEKAMQEALAEVLPSMLPDAEIMREVRIGERSRLDFLIVKGLDRIAIECKLEQGNRASVYRQVRRYAEEAEITGLIVYAPWSGVASFVVEGVPVQIVDWAKRKL